MEAPSRIARRRQTRTRCITIAAVAIVIIILVVTIPTAVVLTRKKSKGVRSTVLVPLYIYPTPGAWDPLFEAVTSHPNLNFTIIINPDSGPGNSTYPGDDYAPQIRNLNAYPNTRTIGYVRTGYAKRNVTTVLRDISVYSNWSRNASANTNSSAPFAVHGIFFDEAAYDYSATTAQYLDTINQAVKDASGLLPDRTVIHNPGVIPDSRLNESSTDITVVFENSFSQYDNKQTSLLSLPPVRSRYSYVIHSVPSDTKLGKFVKDISHRAEYLFLTDRTSDYYEDFGPDFQSFINAVPT